MGWKLLFYFFLLALRSININFIDRIYRSVSKFYLAYHHYEFSLFLSSFSLRWDIVDSRAGRLRNMGEAEIKVSWTHRVNLRETCSFCYFFFLLIKGHGFSHSRLSPSARVSLSLEQICGKRDFRFFFLFLRGLWSWYSKRWRD